MDGIPTSGNRETLLDVIPHMTLWLRSSPTSSFPTSVLFAKASVPARTHPSFMRSSFFPHSYTFFSGESLNDLPDRSKNSKLLLRSVGLLSNISASLIGARPARKDKVNEFAPTRPRSREERHSSMHCWSGRNCSISWRLTRRCSALRYACCWLTT